MIHVLFSSKKLVISPLRVEGFFEVLCRRMTVQIRAIELRRLCETMRRIVRRWLRMLALRPLRVRVPRSVASILSVWLLIGCSTAHIAQSVAERWDPERIDALSSAMPTLQKRWAVPGVSVALLSEGGIQWAAGFGVGGDDGTITPASIFQAASLGKPVFAAITRAAVRRHGWSLEDPLSAWLETGAMNERLSALTPRDLLSHSAGTDFDPAADRIRVDPMSFGRWKYSGAGYFVLQTAIERALGRLLPELADEFLFDPLEMNRSSFVTPDAARLIQGHDRRGRALRTQEYERANAGSSLHTSALDYARFLQYVLAGSRAPGADGFESVVPVDNDLGLAWGLGWALEQQKDGEPIAFHWGSNPGYKSFAMADPNRGLAVVILTNGDNGLELIEDAMGILDPIEHSLFGFYMMHPDD